MSAGRILTLMQKSMRWYFCPTFHQCLFFSLNMASGSAEKSDWILQTDRHTGSSVFGQAWGVLELTMVHCDWQHTSLNIRAYNIGGENSIGIWIHKCCWGALLLEIAYNWIVTRDRLALEWSASSPKIYSTANLLV